MKQQISTTQELEELKQSRGVWKMMNEMRRKHSGVVWFEKVEELEEIFLKFLKKFSEIHKLEEEDSRRRGILKKVILGF